MLFRNRGKISDTQESQKTSTAVRFLNTYQSLVNLYSSLSCICTGCVARLYRRKFMQKMTPFYFLGLNMQNFFQKVKANSSTPKLSSVTVKKLANDLLLILLDARKSTQKTPQTSCFHSIQVALSN